jgi:hypothetical protein
MPGIESGQPHSWLNDVENFYDNHKTQVNLCLLGIAAIGGASVGLKALVKADEELVAEAGTLKFSELSNPERFALRETPTALKFKRFGDPEVFASPSRSAGASSWSVTLPDQVESTVERNPFGQDTLKQQYSDLMITHARDTMSIERPSIGEVILNRSNSTARFMDPSGRLRMVLNPLGDEVRYGEDGRIQSIARNVHRTIDMMGYFS